MHACILYEYLTKQIIKGTPLLKRLQLCLEKVCLGGSLILTNYDWSQVLMIKEFNYLS